MNKKELDKQYRKNQHDIGRLYNTHTSYRELLKLQRMNEIAYRNELAKLSEHMPEFV